MDGTRCRCRSAGSANRPDRTCLGQCRLRYVPSTRRTCCPFPDTDPATTGNFRAKRAVRTTSVTLWPASAQKREKPCRGNTTHVGNGCRHKNAEAAFLLGLWHARMDEYGNRTSDGASSTSFKKAIRWLTQAGEQGLAKAWYALSLIYQKAEFSQRNMADAQHYLEIAACTDCP